jgi:sugar phosphate isomerase/epimerase
MRALVRFGISTHLFHDAPLGREHLHAIAEAGFECVELFATRTHFDYHDPAAAARLAEWLAATGLTLHSVHAPITDSLINGVWGTPWSNASSDPKKRTHTVQEAALTLALARVVPYQFLVVHVGVPDDYAAPSDNARDAARRSIEEMAARAAEHGVRVALEVIPNALSTPESLVRMIEDELELPALGICMDVGHAHVMTGEPADGIETVSGHLVTTHLHDNDGKRDQHLTPFAGTLDWPAALMGFQKVGYDGCLLMELANTDDPRRVLDRARRARLRFEEILAS